MFVRFRRGNLKETLSRTVEKYHFVLCSREGPFVLWKGKPPLMQSLLH